MHQNEVEPNHVECSLGDQNMLVFSPCLHLDVVNAIFLWSWYHFQPKIHFEKKPISLL
jgi:hypothetical protein